MKKIGFKILYGITAAVVFFNLFFTVRESFRFSINDVPSGVYVKTIPSEDRRHLLKIYRYKNSVGKAMRVSLVGDDKTENIYWQTGIDSLECHWINNRYVRINEVVLDIDSDWRYDCRSGYSIFTTGSIEDMDAAEEMFGR